MSISGIALSFLPQSLRKKFMGKEEFFKIISNINWLTLGKILNLSIGIFIAAWAARYLGPQKYGSLNYAIAFVALFSTLSTLGLDAIVVRNIVKNPHKKEEFLGTTLWLKFLGSIVLFILASGLINFVNTDNPKVRIFVVIVAFGYIFTSFGTIDIWFQSQVQSKYTVFSQSFSFMIVSILKILLILTQSPLIAFVWIKAIGSIITAIFLVAFYQAKNPTSVFNWKIRFSTMKSLLKDCWPLILGGITIIIYMRIDQVMIGSMMNSSALGIYSSAVKISEIWYFMPMFISASIFPSIVKAKKVNKKLYLNRLQKLYDFFTWLSISIALFVTIFSSLIINTLYGKEYAQAASVLSIHIWSAIFVFLGVASSKYLVAENLIKISFYRTFLGALSNIILNIVLIPSYGIIGAAYATLFSYAIATFSVILFKQARKQTVGMVKSFNIFRILRFIH